MSHNKTRTALVWAAQILSALIMLGAAAGKLLGSPGWIERFRNWGYPDGLYLVVGVVELVGAIALLIPRFAGAAAAGLLVIMLAAFLTHLTAGEGLAVMRPLIVIVLLAPVLWLRGVGFVSRRRASRQERSPAASMSRSHHAGRD